MIKCVLKSAGTIRYNPTYNDKYKRLLTFNQNKTAKHFVIFLATFAQQFNWNMASSKTPCKIYLRHDQKASDIGAHDSLDVGIYAPSWVKDGLEQLGQKLEGANFAVYEFKTSRGENPPLQNFSITSNLTLSELQKISRNEELNVSGVINWSLYHNGGVNDTKVLLAMKDLVRQSIIAGRDTATHYGGYPSHNSRKTLDDPVSVYVVDLAALQFQQEYNTGRLVLLHKPENETCPSSETTTGLLDDFIFENVVGQKRKSYQEAMVEVGERYIETRGFKNVPCLFDAYAYKKFIAGDVVLTGLAITDLASKHKEKVVLKFLKYGTGFFAGRFGYETSRFILPGVVSGLETLFSKYSDKVVGIIAHVEFPFYKPDPDSEERLKGILDKVKVNYSFSVDDALKPTQKGLIVATTNCGDSMAAMGNEMGYSSVDAAIAENLKSKGFIFCPLLNSKMNTIFL